MPAIDRDSAVPPYQQIAAFLRAMIASGELPPGARVPPVRRLSQEFEVAELTARKAVRVLHEEGLVDVVNGWGTFVTRKKPRRR